MSEYVFVNISDNHFKVWGYDGFCNEEAGTFEVITYWGRIGIPMQKLQKHRKQFSNFTDFRKYVFGKIEEKIHKDYKGVPNHRYFQMIQSPRGIAALIAKVSNLGWEDPYWRKKTKSA